MGNLIKEEFHNYIVEIINNYQDINNKYGLSKRDIEGLYEAKGKVKVEKCISLLNIINDIYKTNYTLENIYNVEYLKDYIEYKRNISIDYGNTNKGNFFDNILRIVKETLEKLLDMLLIKNKVNNKENSLGINNINNTNNIYIIIIYLIIIYILWNVIKNYFL